eukprot:347366-Hanusia_phi.AAC.1
MCFIIRVTESWPIMSHSIVPELPAPPGSRGSAAELHSGPGPPSPARHAGFRRGRVTRDSTRYGRRTMTVLAPVL